MRNVYSIPTIDYHQRKNYDLACQKVNQVLGELRLSPTHPIASVIKDNTRIHYSDIVTGEKNKRYFIKVKLFKDKLNDNHLYKNKVINGVLAQNPQLKLNQFTPKLVGSGENFLLYEFVEGINLGTRRYYNVVKAKIDDIPKITDILESVLEFPTSLLPQDFEKHDWGFLMFQLFKETRYKKDKEIFRRYFSHYELSLVEALAENRNLKALVDANAAYLTHCDFKPSNMLKSDDNITLVDWDLASVGIKYYDLARFYLVSYRKPQLQQIFFQECLKKINFSEDDRILLTLTLFSLLFLESKVLIDRLQDYTRRDWHVLQRLFERKLKDAKTHLCELYRLI